MTLPIPLASFTITTLEAGSFELREHLLVSDGDPDKVIVVPSLSFLLHHSTSGSTILFDLGIKKYPTGYSPRIQPSIDRYFGPCKGDPNVIDALTQISIAPEDVTHVILSHIHWDHIGDHKPFTKAKFFVGGPAKSLIEKCYPKQLETGFLQDTIPEDRVLWTDTQGWKPIGPFERSQDYFDASGNWAYLTGDSAHDMRLITGVKEIGHYRDSEGNFCCMHDNEEVARENIRRIRLLPESVNVWIAHDHQ